MRLFTLTVVLVLFFTGLANGQACSTLGQTPATAFPVCGTSNFQQETVPLCGIRNLVVPGCSGDGAGYMDTNPFWYQFTCYQSGTLGFLITPKDLGDDYDWQLYDITGKKPDEVYTNPSLVVTGNWAGTYGITGARDGGLPNIQCASDPSMMANSFAAMPKIVEGHTYLLLVSHFTATQSGYSLSFEGGTASITDPTIPTLKSLRPNCEGNKLILLLGKKVRCSSLALNGSDFSLDAPGIDILSASGSCSTNFDVDSIVISLSGALQPGTYHLSVKTGDDENTLLDNCENDIAPGSSLPFSITPKEPTPFDSIAPVGCASQTLQLVFSKSIKCSSIAPDGSDFSISGNSPVSIKRAYGSCENDTTSASIFLELSEPLVNAGTYTVSTKLGLDGNTIVDECGEETQTLQSVSFSVKDTVSAAFQPVLLYGCVQDTIEVSHNGAHGVNSWQWSFSNDIQRSSQAATVIYDSYGEKNVSLVVSNGFCADTSSVTVNLDNELKASFVCADLGCPDEPFSVTDTSIGKIISYNWDFGNGQSFSGKTPSSVTYPVLNAESYYTIRLIVTNDLQCVDTAVKKIEIVKSCHIAVPTAFTPNGDGINDYLYPLNAYKAENLLFTVYNRLGQVVFQTKNWTNKWDGRMNGQPQQTGTYVWILRYTNSDTKQFVSAKGTTVLIR